MLIGKHREAVRGYENHRFMQEIQEWSNQTSSAASSAASGRS